LSSLPESFSAICSLSTYVGVYWAFSPVALRFEEVLPEWKYLAKTGWRKDRKTIWAPLMGLLAEIDDYEIV
jgi:hypothetical protein